MNRQEIQLLERIGLALHGTYWMSELCRNQGFALRNVQRWMAGTRPIDPKIWPQLLSEIEGRQTELSEIEHELKTAVHRKG